MPVRNSQAPDLVVVYRKRSWLKPYANNARVHTRRQLRKIIASLQEFGWTNPVIIDEEGNVLCGHGRLLAAEQLGINDIPTITLSHLSDAQRRAYILADNVIAEKGGWSKAMLRSELQGLVEIGYDVELTGFDTLEIDTLLSFDTSEADAAGGDDVVELPRRGPPVSRVGDLWWIGPHRLIVGDSRDTEVVGRMMAGELAQLVLTDPPFGCRIANNVSGLGKVKHEDFQLGAGETSLPVFAQTLLRPAFKTMALFSRKGAVAFVFCDWRAAPHFLDAATGVFQPPKNLIVWSKTNAGMGTFYRSAHELIYAFQVSSGPLINNFGLGEGGRHRSNVWVYQGANTFRHGRMQDLEDHPTCKPRRLCEDAILDCSRANGIVLDSFAGSATTICAAAKTGRRGFGVEIDPKYADVSLRRISEQLGEPARLDGEATFEEVAAARNLTEEAGK